MASPTVTHPPFLLHSYNSLLLLPLHDDEMANSPSSPNDFQQDQPSPTLFSPIHSPLSPLPEAPHTDPLDDQGFNIADEDGEDVPVDPSKDVILGSVDESLADHKDVFRAHFILPVSPKNKGPHADFLCKLPGIDLGPGFTNKDGVFTKDSLKSITREKIYEKTGDYLRNKANAMQLWDSLALHKGGHWKSSFGSWANLSGRNFYFTFAPGELNLSHGLPPSEEPPSTPLGSNPSPSFKEPGAPQKRPATVQGSRAAPLKRTSTNDLLSFASHSMVEDIAKLTSKLSSITQGTTPRPVPTPP